MGVSTTWRSAISTPFARANPSTALVGLPSGPKAAALDDQGETSRGPHGNRLPVRQIERPGLFQKIFLQLSQGRLEKSGGQFLGPYFKK